jgi:5-methylcytosine-specific restriction protein A
MAVKNGRCEDHKIKHGWNHTNNSDRRGYDSKWRKTRKRILERDGYLCQVCLESGIIREAKQVDHIKNKKSGGTDDDSNLQAICIPCHKEKTRLERNGDQ